MASSPAIVYCTVCHMYSLSISVSSEVFTCDECRKIVRLTETILGLETRIQTLFEDSNGAFPLHGMARYGSLLGGFPLGTVSPSSTFLVPPRQRFQVIHTVTNT